MPVEDSIKKACKECGDELELKEFGVDKSMKDGRRAACRECRKEEGRRRYASFSPEQREILLERTRQWRRDFPEKYKAAYQRGNRKDKYGIDEVTYQKMLAEQDGKCAICRQTETLKGNGTDVNRLAVDHDHRTGAIRQLLCGKCNGGLGFFRDDPALLKAALSYLEKHKPVA